MAGLAIASRFTDMYSITDIEAGDLYEIENSNNSVVP
jgi:hypothetical protein